MWNSGIGNLIISTFSRFAIRLLIASVYMRRGKESYCGTGMLNVISIPTGYRNTHRFVKFRATCQPGMVKIISGNWPIHCHATTANGETSSCKHLWRNNFSSSISVCSKPERKVNCFLPRKY